MDNATRASSAVELADARVGRPEASATDASRGLAPRRTADPVGADRTERIVAKTVDRAPYPSMDAVGKALRTEVNRPASMFNRGGVTQDAMRTAVGSVAPAISRAVFTGATALGSAATIGGSVFNGISALAGVAAMNSSGDAGAAALAKAGAQAVKAAHPDANASEDAEAIRRTLEAAKPGSNGAPGSGEVIANYGATRSRRAVKTTYPPGRSPEEFNDRLRARAAGETTVAIGSTEPTVSRRPLKSVKSLNDLRAATQLPRSATADAKRANRAATLERLGSAERTVFAELEAHAGEPHLLKGAEKLDAHANAVGKPPEAHLLEAALQIAPQLAEKLPIKP